MYVNLPHLPPPFKVGGVHANGAVNVAGALDLLTSFVTLVSGNITKRFWIVLFFPSIRDRANVGCSNKRTPLPQVRKAC